MNVFLSVGLNIKDNTSNMNNLALIVSLVGSLALYLVEIKELKCAVVGKISPLIKFYWVSSIFLSLLKKEEDDLICFMHMMSGSPRRHLFRASRERRLFVIDSELLII